MNVSVFPNAPQGWNEFLAQSEFGTFYQTSFYADYALKEAGLKPVFLRAEENGRTTGQLLLLKGSRFQNFLANQPLHFITTKLSRALIPSYSWVYGPVCNDDAAASALLSKAVEVSKGKISNCNAHPLSNFVAAFSRAGFKKRPWATFLIDLSLSEEDLWKNVDSSARKLVNRTLEQVEVKQVESEAEYRSYHDVVNENRKRNGVAPYRYSPLLWELWRKTGSGGVFIAKRNGEVLAGLGVSSFKGYLNEWGAGTSSKALSEKIYAQDAVKWSVIKWAKAKGFRYFDLTGVNPTPENDKEKGIFRFKEKWGGKLVETPNYRL